MDILTIVVAAVFCIIIGFGVAMFVISIINIYYGIVNYKKPEYYCSNCGKEILKKRAVCPKCKSLFVEENMEGEKDEK